MDIALNFFQDNITWIAPLIAAIVGGTIMFSRINKQSGNSNQVDQSNSRAKGDIVGRDKLDGDKP